MTTAQVLSFVTAQTWQVAVLWGIVWLVVRYATREHSHVSHMLWTLVLIKCLTPPIWSSPVGLFSRWSPTTVLSPLSDASQLSKEQSSSRLTTSAISIGSDEVLPETPIATQVGTPAKAGALRDLRPAGKLVPLSVRVTRCEGFLTNSDRKISQKSQFVQLAAVVPKVLSLYL